MSLLTKSNLKSYRPVQYLGSPFLVRERAPVLVTLSCLGPQAFPMMFNPGHVFVSPMTGCVPLVDYLLNLAHGVVTFIADFDHFKPTNLNDKDSNDEEGEGEKTSLDNTTKEYFKLECVDFRP
jgi:hypothetical protein